MPTRSEVRVQGELMLVECGHHAGALIITDSFFEEVCFASDGNIVHEIEWTIAMIDLNTRNEDDYLEDEDDSHL